MRGLPTKTARRSQKQAPRPAGVGGELVEVVDDRDRPLCLIPLPEVHRQSLPHRSVLILLFDLNGRLYLQKRSARKTLYPGRLDLSATGHVRGGESREAAALRELREELGVRVRSLRLLSEVPAGPDTGWEVVTLYTAGRVPEPPCPDGDEVESGLFVEPAELDYLVRNYRDMLTPGLVHFWESGLLFPSEKD